jgi:hypothetical protein
MDRLSTTEWSKSHATHKSVTRENFTIMLAVILILCWYNCFPLHAPQVLERPWLHPVHPQSSENVICEKTVFFPQDQRVFTLEHHFSTRSYAECQNAFRNYFPDSVVTNKSTVQRLVERFRDTGSIGEKRRSGRPSVLSNDSLEQGWGTCGLKATCGLLGP